MSEETLERTAKAHKLRTYTRISCGPCVPPRPATFETDRFDQAKAKRLLLEAGCKDGIARNDLYLEGVDGCRVAFEHHFASEARVRLNAFRSGQTNMTLIEVRQILEA